MSGLILVTGGCGYVGCRLVPALLDQGWRVRVLDAQFFGDLVPRRSVPERLDVRKADIRDENAVAAALQGVDTVIHLAAMSNDPSAELDPELTRAINLDATVRLIRRAKAEGVARFVNASTATVYGVRAEPDVDEATPHRPISLYGRFKSETDLFLSAESGRGFAGVNLRAATVCGWSPRMRLDLTVNIFAAQAVAAGRLRVHGGQQRRPNVVIEDLVRAYLLLANADAELVCGQSFNVCASNHTVLELAEIVAASAAPACEIVIEPVQDARSYHVSARKIAEQLNFSCHYDVSDGAKQVAQAIGSGRLADPAAAIHSNIRHLLETGVAVRRAPHDARLVAARGP
ncbi:MAG: SDR family oxidoreductase [Alphaproteobacteria bacterium]|nr:MAG: SDR family oxidoreductase [Alphaproteobacteria bacterium]